MAVFNAAIEAIASSTTTEAHTITPWDIAKNIESLPSTSFTQGNLSRMSLFSEAVNEGLLSPWHANSTIVTTENSRVKRMDLHGYPVSVAKTAIDYVLQEMKNSNEVYSLEIITGRGNHVNSSGTRGVLRVEIEEYITRLQPSGILFTDESNDNRGTIVVTRESINAWFNVIDSMLNYKIVESK